MADEVIVTLGQQIRTERENIEMSGREMERRVGISAAYLCDIEYNRRLPSLRVLRKIGKLIDVEYGCNHGSCRRCGKPWPK